MMLEAVFVPRARVLLSKRLVRWIAAVQLRGSVSTERT
jgi:hypothetical protein